MTINKDGCESSIIAFSGLSVVKGTRTIKRAVFAAESITAATVLCDPTDLPAIRCTIQVENDDGTHAVHVVDVVGETQCKLFIDQLHHRERICQNGMMLDIEARRYANSQATTKALLDFAQATLAKNAPPGFILPDFSSVLRDSRVGHNPTKGEASDPFPPLKDEAKHPQPEDEDAAANESKPPQGEPA